MTRKIHKLLPAVAIALAASDACAQVVYDPFNYTTGATLDSGSNFSTSGTFWAQRGSQAGVTTVASGSLGTATVGSVPVLPETMGNSALYPSATFGRTSALGFGQTFTTPGDYYYSLTLKAPTTLTAGSNQIVAGMSNFSIPTPNAPGVFQAGLRMTSVAGGAGTGNFTLGMSSGGTAQQFTGDTFDPDETVFVVARYRIVAGTANDQVAMWINPNGGFGDNSAAILGTPSLSWNHTTGDSVDAVLNNPMLASFFLRTQAAAAGFQVDEVRVDSTWAGVTPDGTKQFHFANNAGGNWSDPNWEDYTHTATVSSPNMTGHVANFGPAIASGSTITVDGGGKTVDTVNLNNAGSLTIAGTDTLTFSSPASAGQIIAQSGTHSVTAPISSIGNLSLKTQGSGTSITLGNSVTMAGPTKVLGVYGTGTVNLGASNLIDDTARLEVRSGTLNLGGNTEFVDTLQLGTSHPNNGSAISLGVTYNGDLASGTISNGTISANNYDLQSGTISANITGAANVVKNQSGVVTLSGGNSYTGNTVVNQGVLRLTGTNSSPVNAILNAPTSERGGTSTLIINSDGSLGGVGATVTISTTGGTSGTLQFGENMTLASNRSIVANATNSRIAAANGKTAIIDAPISGTGGINITYPWDPAFPSAGADNNNVRFGAVGTPGGVVVLRGTNTYAGNTTVSGGRLLLPSTSSAPGFGIAGKFGTIAPPDYPPNSTSPTSTPSSIGGILSVAYGGPSDWSDADVDTLRTTTTWGQTVGTFPASNFNTLFPAGTYLGFDTTNATGTATYTPTISSGNHGVSKHGAGTLVMSGDIGVSGNIYADGGTLSLTGNLSNAASVIAASGGTIQLSGNVTSGGSVTALAGGTVENTGTLAHAGTVTANGGTVVLGGNNTYAGQTIAENGGVVRVTHNNGLGTTAGNTLVRGGDHTSVVQIDGSAGDVTSPEPFQLSGRTPTTAIAINNIAGNNTLTGTLNYGTGGSQYNLASNGGTLTIAGDITNTLTGTTTRQLNLRGTAAGVVTGNLTNSGNTDYRVVKHDSGTWTLSGVNGNTSTTVNAGTLQMSRLHENNAVTVNAGTLRVLESDPDLASGLPSGDNAAVSRPSSLTVAVGATLDLTNNDLILDYTDELNNPAVAIEDLIASGYNGGDWLGTGITSSIAQQDGNFALAIADNALLTSAYSSFDGQTVDTTTVLVKFTWVDDLDLDGQVTSNDAITFGNNYSPGDPATRATGDMDYDGVYTSNDAILFGNAYDTSLPSLPEPGTLGVLGLAAAAGMLRRRRGQA